MAQPPTTYTVTVKCDNCFWKGIITLAIGSSAVLDGHGYISGIPCANCACEQLKKDDR